MMTDGLSTARGSFTRFPERVCFLVCRSRASRLVGFRPRLPHLLLLPAAGRSDFGVALVRPFTELSKIKRDSLRLIIAYIRIASIRITSILRRILTVYRV